MIIDQMNQLHDRVALFTQTLFHLMSDQSAGDLTEKSTLLTNQMKCSNRVSEV